MSWSYVFKKCIFMRTKHRQLLVDTMLMVQQLQMSGYHKGLFTHDQMSYLRPVCTSLTNNRCISLSYGCIGRVIRRGQTLSVYGTAYD